MIKELMSRFLNQCYPVKRIKVDGRFKRTVEIHSIYYILSDNRGLKDCSFKLLEVLELVFGYNDVNLMKDVIGYHLGLR